MGCSLNRSRRRPGRSPESCLASSNAAIVPSRSPNPRAAPEGPEAGSDGRTVVSPPTLTGKGDGGEGNNQATGHKPVIPASKVVTAARSPSIPESKIVDESTGIDFAQMKCS